MVTRFLGVLAFSATAVLLVGVFSESAARQTSQANPSFNSGAAKPAGAGRVTFNSVSVDFPDSTTTFPNGAGVDVVTENCTICHSPGMILNQPALSASAWQAEVSKMRLTYKAPINDADAAKIVTYLVGIRGKATN